MQCKDERRSGAHGAGAPGNSEIPYRPHRTGLRPRHRCEREVRAPNIGADHVYSGNGDKAADAARVIEGMSLKTAHGRPSHAGHMPAS